MKVILFIAACMLKVVCTAQFKQVIVEQVDNAGKVPGKTYRIYAELTSVEDQVYVIYGDTAHPLVIKSTTPFFQSSDGGAMAKDSNRKAITLSDSLKYDSWITIGAVDNYDNNLNALNLELEEFEKKGGAITCKKDGAWFCLPTDKQAFSKADKKILLMQLTTTGEITGSFCIMGKTAAGESYQVTDVTFKAGEKKKKK